MLMIGLCLIDNKQFLDNVTSQKATHRDMMFVILKGSL